jgi:hypothetical protein
MNISKHFCTEDGVWGVPVAMEDRSQVTEEIEETVVDPLFLEKIQNKCSVIMKTSKSHL